MAGASTEESGVGRPHEGVSSGQQKQVFQSGEALAEWRSLEQVENGSPSTSPLYWDSDDDDNHRGPKPADLYGKHTWKIDKFSQINKRELRSNAFEVGGYKWYILIYPQGCDVSNHLSLFLCVAQHDKLLPGWSHFAQFTIAVVNKDPKKSKYSDTLHKFWKKEHDWGWKKFMELSKVMDGFVDADTLIIKAQVQVIRERVDRPFRCLDCQYRRELVRVYLTNVEQICRRFMEERKGKLRILIEDKARWSSFCAFWVGEDHSSRLRMSSEKTESILKVAVKLFFIEKEVTSTLVMDSLYSGLKALEGQNKGKKNKGKCLEAEELPAPIVRVEKDKFSLVDDVLLLIERAAVEPLPPKDDKKGPQNRTKDGSAGEDFNKDSIERDERRLTELGRRTIELFVLSHIFSKIEAAYQEAVSLKKQEELIREEEASCLAELEQKARRAQTDKEKKAKKKQGKQKRNNRKGKDKGRDERTIITVQDKIEEDSPAEINELASEPESVIEISEAAEYVSDVSDSVDCAPKILKPDSEDRDLIPANSDTDTSDVPHPIESGSSSSKISGLSGVIDGIIERSPSLVDDSSSTCSTDSVPSVVADKGKSRYHQNKKSSSRGASHQTRLMSESVTRVNEEPSQPVLDARRSNDASQSSNTVGSHPQPSVPPLQRVEKKEEETGPNRKNIVAKATVNKITPLVTEPKLQPKVMVIPNQAAEKQLSSSSESAAKPKQLTTASQPSEKTVHGKSDKLDKSSLPYIPVMSRPLSAPLIPGPRPAPSMVSIAPTAPVLSRSVSAAGRLGPEFANQGYIPQSYRNAIIGPGPGPSHSYSQAAPQAFSARPPDHNLVKPIRSFGAMSPRENGLPVWNNNNGQQSYDLYNPVSARPPEFRAPPSGRQSHVVQDEFPHLDIINDLLDDEHGMGPSFGNGPHNLNRHYSFPGDNAMLGGIGPSCRFDRAQSYREEGIQQHGYGVGAGSNMVQPQVVGPHSYLNGQIEGLLPNQWQMSGSDVSYLSLRSLDSEGGYPYHIPEYTNLTGGINGGYTVYRPSNGH